MSLDDLCTCNHSEDQHDEKGRCTYDRRFRCSCRRYRSYTQKLAQTREERFWSKVGGY